MRLGKWDLGAEGCIAECSIAFKHNLGLIYHTGGRVLGYSGNREPILITGAGSSSASPVH
jgi:hypothetical protein